MNYDRQIGISVGNSRKSLNWQNTQMSVSEFYEKLKTPVRGTEAYAEYMKMKKAQQDTLKDVGGFVGGSLNSPRRKSNNVTGRDVITLDFDNIPGWQTDAVIAKVEELGCSYCIYSTRKHNASAPRLRVVIPFDRTVTPDEYEPCARRVASSIGITMADPTTFEVCRLMYWPSCSSDSEYVYKTKDAPLISADFLLSTYKDWHDLTSWPQVPGAISYAKLAMKQGDPLEKPGIVGAFCRTYDVITAMDAFLPKIYEPVDNDDGRYTYLGGSTTGGAVIYDDAKFLYSHHATDPCGGRLVNAFDLIRLHRFGEKDNDSTPDTPVNKLPSYRAMCDMAMQDKAVVTTLNREQIAQAKQDFEGVAATEAKPEEDPLDWAEKLQRNSQGLVAKTSANFAVILSEDPLLKGRIKYDTFSHRLLGVPPLPWGQREKATANFAWVDEDDSGLRMYIEKVYGIRAENMMSDAFNDCVARNNFNPVQDLLKGLTWDGVPRLDTLFIDYLGADNTDYNKAVTRKAFVAAVSRAMIPGCKYDNMLILSGPQGIGKSTLLDKMSYGWFNDSIRTFEGKEASELLRGVWIAEIAELDAFRRSDVARIKQFLSIREDRYREAYGHHVKTFPRSCVLFGTTNTTDFLQDATGNRRFWPVDVGKYKPTKNVFTELDNEKEQIWAEAKARWQTGEAMYLADEMAEEAIKQQEEHMSINPWEGLIREFLEKQIPADWSKWKLDRRLDYWAGATHSVNEIRLVNRERVCIPEIWCEAMKRRLGDISDNPKNNKEIGAILRRLGWVQKSNQRFGEYGLQRCFVPVNKN